MFENTYGDLARCVSALQNGKEISDCEMMFAKEMRRLCERFIEEFDDYKPVEEDEEE
jgi:hypothetical protein